MSVDETNTVDALTMTRRIAREELDLHGGWLFGLPGDGIFALFESAVDAVKCALETQQRLLAMSRLSTMRLRIGVHLGEVVFQDGLPYGEALVIAARLESHAEPGGVLVSAAVMDAVAPRIAAQFYERGVFNLKHSPRRIATYSVSVGEPSRDLDLSSGAGEPLDRTVLSVPATFGSKERPLSEEAGLPGPTALEIPVPETVAPLQRAEPILPPARPHSISRTMPRPEMAEPVRTSLHQDLVPKSVAGSEPGGTALVPIRPDGVPEAASLPDPAMQVLAPVRMEPVAEMVSLPDAPAPVLAPVRQDDGPEGQSLPDPAAPVLAPVRQDEAPKVVSLPDPAVQVLAPVRPEPVPEVVSLPKATPLVVRSLIPEAEPDRGEPAAVRSFARSAAEVVLSPDCAEAFVHALTQHIGPVAGVLVRRLASRYADPLEFIDALAEEIPAESERVQFRVKARQVIGRPH